MDIDTEVMISRNLVYEPDRSKIRTNLEASYESLTRTDLNLELPYVRSEYVYHANCLIELILLGEPGFHYEKDSLQKMYEILNEFTNTFQVEKLNVEHWNLIWAVKCRIRCLLFVGNHLKLNNSGYIKLKEPLVFGSFEELLELKKLGLLIPSTSNISDYTLDQLWSAIGILITTINYLEYREIIYRYFRYLELCCSKFMNNIFPDTRECNNLYFTRVVKNKEGKIFGYSVNKEFFKQTGFVFYDLNKKFEYKKKFRMGSDSILISDLSVLKFRNWISENAKGKFFEIVQKFVSRQIFNNYVFPTEKIRYTIENPLLDPSAYNIIGKYKPKLLTYLVNKFGDDTISAILKDRVHQTETDHDYALLCIRTLDIFFETSGVIDKLSTFIIDELSPSINNYIHSSEYPYLVKIFNKYHVLDKESVYSCPCFEKAFLTWLYIICSEKHGRLPSKGRNLIDLFTEFFPDEKRVNDEIRRVTFVRREEVPHLSFKPDFYDKLQINQIS
jgi:hypothetical protein